MKMPDAIDLHLFFAPECDFNFGNCAVADVEKSRAVPRTRVTKNIVVKNEDEGGVEKQRAEEGH